MKKPRKLILILLIAALLPSGALLAPPWQLVFVKQGIRVSKRSGPNSLLEFMARGRVNASILKILSVIHDVNSYGKWVPRNRETRILRRVSDTELIFYQANKGFWPVSDRDFVGRAVLRPDEKNKIVTMVVRNIPGARPVYSGRVRMPRVHSIWTLKSLGKNKTLVNLYVYADPAGWLPKWIVNWASKDVPFDLIRNLRRRVTQVDRVNAAFLRKYGKYADWH